MLFTFAGYAWCAAAGLCGALATVMMKISANHHAAGGWIKLYWLAGAAACYVVGFGAYSQALAKLEMTVAYPLMTAVTMSIVACAGCLLLGESITGYKVAGMVLLCAAVVLMSK
jgi:small multidrug resistance pump